MLQVPTSFDEHGETPGIPNSYLIGYSYFYLSVVRKLQGDEWQVAMHFLNALVVSPKLLHTEITTDLCRSLLFLCFGHEGQEQYSLGNLDENEVYAMTVKMGRRYKAWLMYHQIMSSGAAPLRNGEGSTINSNNDELEQTMSRKFKSTRCSNLCKHGNNHCTCPNLGAGFVIAEATLSNNSNLSKLFCDCKEYVIVTCQSSNWVEKVDELCQVYETVETMVLSPDEVLRITFQPEEPTATPANELKSRFKKLSLVFGNKDKLSAQGQKSQEESPLRQPFSSIFSKKPPKPGGSSPADKPVTPVENDWTIV